MGQRVLATLRSQLFRHLQALSLSYHDRNIIGDLVVLVGAIIVRFSMNPGLALLAFGILSLMALATFFFARQTQVAFRKTRASVAAIICIARAVLANPRIFILDEATASVDTVTESLIQAALDRLLSGHTAIVIAHRLSTIPNADLICVIDHGRIVEQGTHDSLLTRHGVYHRLYERQFLPPAPLQPWHSPTCITLLNGVMIKFTGLWQFLFCQRDLSTFAA